MREITLFWQTLDPSVQGAIIGVIGTFVTAVLALGGLAWQLRTQARQSTEAIAENERRKLKAAMYEDAVSVSRAMTDASISLSTQLRSMAQEVRTASAAATDNRQYPLPRARFPALMDGYHAFSEAALRFIFLVEDRRFIDPRLLVFRTAMNVVLHDASQLMFSRFVPDVMPLLPTEGPDGLFPYTPPSTQAAEAISLLSDQVIASLEHAVSNAEDFLVEMQNCLVGDLFGYKVSHREPLDPDSKVITLDNSRELENWFNTSTAWGKMCAEVEAETRKRFEPAQTRPQP